MKHLATFLLATMSCPATDVTTGQYDIARTGANTSETILTQANVAGARFGKKWDYSVSGYVWAQPLVRQNTLVIATGTNQLYAVNSTTGATIWHNDLGSPYRPGAPFAANFPDGNIGIIATPVIDSLTNVVYFTTCNSSGAWSLHAVNLADGTDFHAAATLSATASGVIFASIHHLQRPALLLLNGLIFIAFGAYDDQAPWYGWIMAHNKTTLAQTASAITTPNMGQSQGSIWMSGGGPASDGTNIFFTTGNGPCDTGDYGDSFVEMSQSLVVTDFMTPSNCSGLSTMDQDLGSGRAIVDGAYIRGGGKDGKIWTLNKSALGSNQGSGPSIPQSFTTAIAGALMAGMAVANSTLYIQQGANGQQDAISSYSCPTTCNTTPVAASSSSSYTYASLAYSSNGATAGTGVLWASTTTGNADQTAVAGTFTAFNADTMATLFTDSTIGNFAKFSMPTVANGLVYVPTFSGIVRAYGLASGGSSYSGKITFGGPIVGN